MLLKINRYYKTNSGDIVACIGRLNELNMVLLRPDTGKKYHHAQDSDLIPPFIRDGVKELAYATKI